MFAKLKTAALAALVALGAFAAVPATAQASDFSFGFGSANGAVTVQFGSGRGWDRGYDRHHGPRRACSERQAVYKAADMGLRHARVVHSSHRAIEVRGRSHRHGRTTVVFARAPHCPVIARY
jgi:hypothetical protein